MTQYKLEMHLHTLGYSPCAQTDEKTIAKLYAEQNYNGIVCTNHFNRYLCDEYYKQGSPEQNVSFFVDGYRKLKTECSKYGMDVFFGIELCIDSLTYYKPTPPHAELLIYEIDENWLLAHPYDLFGLSLQQLKELCDANNWILSQAHPFRTGITSQNPTFLEGTEVWNGNPRSINNNGIALQFAKSNNLLATAGSDFHCVGDEGCGVLLQTPIKDNNELVAELRKRQHVPFNTETTIQL